MNKRKSTEIIKFIFGGKLLVAFLTWFAMDFFVEATTHADETLDKIVLSSAQTTGWFVFLATLIILIMYISALVSEGKRADDKKHKSI